MDGSSLVQKYIAKKNLFMNIKMIVLIILVFQIKSILIYIEIIYFLLGLILIKLIERLNLKKYTEKYNINMFPEKYEEFFYKGSDLFDFSKYYFFIYYIFIFIIIILKNLDFYAFYINALTYTLFLALDYEHIRHQILESQERFLGMAYLAHLKSEKNLIDDIEEAYYNFDLKNKRRV